MSLNDHIAQRIVAGFHIRLDDSKTPPTFLVEKKENEWRRRHKQWKRTKEETQYHISRIPKQQMREALGARFEELYNLNPPAPPAGTSTSSLDNTSAPKHLPSTSEPTIGTPGPNSKLSGSSQSALPHSTSTTITPIQNATHQVSACYTCGNRQ
ncbi:uncharacterized protein BDZ99DRAFT_504699 [Mytilinidion resinicola]|uniref:Uncharacterized protein n=1 Tax=Mytilinidion resinicola TaxID=574789 RepID=A0A6A6XY33_9PEZI|nr:uncharacterized protein BDZ99DRAFT_504699 [Mytilinidion resinicola]KAF2801340.1 hypothetical protein BDZ99DRAFT_504699 [Mytilinidion resinicola]